MAQGACLMLAQTRSGSRSAVRLGGWVQPRIKLPRKGIGWYGTVQSLPATLPLGSEGVLKMQKRPVGTGCPDWPCECRGDWIRTSDLLNPIQGTPVQKDVAEQGVTATTETACTTACTNEPPDRPTSTLQALATSLL